MTPSGQQSAIHLRTSLCRPPVPDVRVSEARRAELRDRFDDLYAALNLETALATRRQKIERLAGTQLPACARPPPASASTASTRIHRRRSLRQRAGDGVAIRAPTIGHRSGRAGPPRRPAQAPAIVARPAVI